jgi:hypothetical protein
LTKIIILVENLSVQAELNETYTAEKIFEALPFEGNVNLWGDEIYFDIPLELDLESNAIAEVEVGSLGYWPSGPAFCIFFGPTPVSRDEKPRAYSPVNIFGRIIGDSSRFKTVSNGSNIQITRYEQ